MRRQSRTFFFFKNGTHRVAELAEMARAGWTQRQMAAAFGVCPDSINTALSRYGIDHIRTRGPRPREGLSASR